ncbi:hypothetical protein [Adhaeribacter rhizoryzae]|uniref:Outer membrane protein beta-barrel domain-containing protein n=1 Tax=Adhaeribacter rhizoryzae TaxID=2607907 RepID=A0A5M6D033_9BACT|nr:hypothetical protein [Adhaeribacter rhizoryzae]KAA5539652.1 hypothetical protein F0145_23995 [Adhaeribacter rhizoryzae]
MKKALLILFLGVFMVPYPVAFAQRHVKHISAWGTHLGRTDKGTFYEVSYANYLTDKLTLRVSGLREHGELSAAGNYLALSSRLFIAPELFRIGEAVYFHLLLGVSGAYERTNELLALENSENDKAYRTRFTYGPQAGAEADIFFSNRISLVVSGTKGKIFNNSHLDEWPGYAALGLRYHCR